MLSDLVFIDKNKYEDLYSDNFVPLPIQIDLKAFEEQIASYKSKFRDWGKKFSSHMFRKGISVVNMTGSLDDDFDPCIYPQDQLKEELGLAYFDNMYTSPTILMNLPCFDCFKNLKPFMIRSAILWWKKGSFFHPHVDTEIPTPYLRVWGTNKPELYNFTYLDGSNYKNPKWEPGRIYLTNTVKKHYAEAMGDDVFTFFFNFDARAYDILMEMKNELRSIS